MLRKFSSNDLFVNRVLTRPRCEFHIYGEENKIWYNQMTEISGNWAPQIKMTSVGDVSLYELNIDRKSGSLIYPFLIKTGDRQSFNTITDTNFNTCSYGTVLIGTYPISASISGTYYAANASRKHVTALRNTLDTYKTLSPHYEYSSSLGNKATQAIALITVPSVFYGTRITPGTVRIDAYNGFTLSASLEDLRQNGELVQTTGSAGTGSVAGVVLYNEGIILITGSWSLATTYTWASYVNKNFFQKTASPYTSRPMRIEFEGENTLNTLTMYCHAPRGELNHSNNPTYIQSASQWDTSSSSFAYIENPKKLIKNVVATDYADPTGAFEKTVYLSRIGVYDKDRNLIAIAKLANPLRKREHEDFTIKLKVDLV